MSPTRPGRIVVDASVLVDALSSTGETGWRARDAVLPCYWIYARVGDALAQRSSPDPLYARCIAMYGGEGFQATVDEVLAMTERVGGELSTVEAARVREHFVTTARYEWMFWDAGYRQEPWPI